MEADTKDVISNYDCRQDTIFNYDCLDRIQYLIKLDNYSKDCDKKRELKIHCAYNRTLFQAFLSVIAGISA